MIRFACPNCGRHISVDDKHSRKKGRCPKCESVVVVPVRSTIIEFDCESCGHKIRVPETYTGRKGRCPKCKQPVVVPSLRKESPEKAGTLTVACLMCGAAIDVPGDSAEEYLECPECGAYVGISPDGAPAASAEPDGSMPSTPGEDLYQEGPETPRGPVSLDRRLIIVISGAVAIVVVGLVILVAVLRSSGSRPITSDSQPMRLRVDQAQEFAEQYIGLLDNGELDEAHRLLSPAFADDVGRPQMERFSEQISKSGIVKMDCRWTHRQQHSEGDRVFLRYDLWYATGWQAVIISVIQIEQELKIDAVAARDVSRRTVSVGPYNFDALSRIGATAASSERSVVRPTRLLQVLIVGMAVGTVTSACCLWVGMKVTDVEGTFGTMLGIAAICSLVSFCPLCWVVGQPRCDVRADMQMDRCRFLAAGHRDGPRCRPRGHICRLVASHVRRRCITGNSGVSQPAIAGTDGGSEHIRWIDEGRDQARLRREIGDGKPKQVKYRNAESKSAEQKPRRKPPMDDDER